MDVINDGLDPEYFSKLVTTLQLTPLYREQGLTPLRLGKGYTEFTIGQSKTVFNSKGDIHGGVLMTCADTAMGTAVRAIGIKTATIEQSSHFIRPCPRDADILCVGKIIHFGSNLFFCQSEIHADQKLVASFEGVFGNFGPEQLHLPYIPE